MNVLVLGGGGREHAICHGLAKSPSVEAIYATPGSDAIARLGTIISIPVGDAEALAGWALEHAIDLIVVGPEAPLVDGAADVFRAKGLNVAGPSAQAAMLEGSKSFAKSIMTDAGVPTAAYGEFTDLDAALDYLKSVDHKVVVKADGLAAGKGVIVCDTKEEAEEALRSMLVDGTFKDAGAKVIIEQRLEGEEASLLALTDGMSIVPLPSAQDHKRTFDNDEGPNTGGMGAYSPAPVLTGELYDKAVKLTIEPIVRTMAEKGIPYNGVLYAGLMICDGEPYVLEYNCRFGDPEAQPLISRLTSDFGEVLLACAKGTLGEVKLEWDERPAVCIVLASGGYPGSYPKGVPMSGIEDAEKLDDVIVYHAGTKLTDQGWATSGGRVLGVTALGDTIAAAVEKAYEAAALITFDGKHQRSDIAKRALNR